MPTPFPFAQNFLFEGLSFEDRIIMRQVRSAQLEEALSQEDATFISGVRDRLVSSLVEKARDGQKHEEALRRLPVYSGSPVVFGELVLHGWVNDYDLQTYVKDRQKVTVPLSWLHAADRALLENVANGDEEAARSIICDIMPDIAQNNHFSFEVSDAVKRWITFVSPVGDGS